jgi:dihydrolipoyl dehydrogenase
MGREDRTNAQESFTHDPEAQVLLGDLDLVVRRIFQAADEGRIAGINAASRPTGQEAPNPFGHCLHRSQLAVVGTGFPDLEGNVAIGSIDYRDQGRARVIGKNAGLIRIYSPA